MIGDELKERLKLYALRIIRLYTALPNDAVAQTIGKQVLRSGTSVGAQHREACQPRSNAEFISKMKSALQELDETEYWLELLLEADVFDEKRLSSLLTETGELKAIFITIISKSRK